MKFASAILLAAIATAVAAAPVEVEKKVRRHFHHLE